MTAAATQRTGDPAFQSATGFGRNRITHCGWAKALNLQKVTLHRSGGTATLFGWLFSGLTVDVFDCIEFKDWF